MQIDTPLILFHGTTSNLLPSFQGRLLDSQYWKLNRDFGRGFYTTTHVEQARNWARRMEFSSPDPSNLACVLYIELNRVLSLDNSLFFLRENESWAEFILNHRTAMDTDPCDLHPELIIGPMADGDTGEIVKDCVRLKKDVLWFKDKITKSKKGRRLHTSQLGNQVVFCSVNWEQCMKLVGYSIFQGERWVYYDQTSPAQLL